MAASHLHISKVQLENFKSYSGLVTVEPIHPNFTAIIGPNGCGKSNLLEAVLFVVGKKAANLRLGRVRELINNGPQAREPESARVAVTFQTPAGELVLSRTCFRAGGVSLYHLNDIEAKLSDVQTKLKEIGMDLEHDRFMIMQGEVELISSMKPKSGYTQEGKKKHPEGLLEYFEGLIGTAEYVGKIAEEQENIEELGRKVGELREDLTKVEARKLILRDPAVDTMKQVTAKLNIYKLINVQLQLQKYMTETKLTNETLHISEINIKIHSFETAISKLTSRKADLTATANSLQEAISALTLKLGVKEEEVSLQSESVVELDVKKQEFDRKKADLVSKMEKIRETLVRCELPGVDLKKSLEDGEYLASLKTQTQGMLQKQLVARDAQSAPIPQPLLDQLYIRTLQKQSSEAEFRKCESIHKDLIDRRRNLEKTLIDEKEERRILNQKKQDLDTMLSQLGVGINALKSQETALTISLTGLTETRKQKSSEILECEKRISLEHLAMEQARKTFRKMENRRNLDTQLSHYLALGNLPGVLGRLGDLASIDPGYDTAISTVFGHQLDSYVAKTVSAAEGLIDFCRTQKLGKVTVYILDQIPDYDFNPTFRSPDSTAVRLFDQLTIEKSVLGVKKVFYHVVKDTLATENIEDANRVAFGLGKRWTVVTKEGDVIRPTGEMQGFAQPISGKMRKTSGGHIATPDGKAIQEHIEKMCTDLIDLRTDYNAVQRQEERLIVQVQQLRMQLALAIQEREFKDKEKTMVCQELMKPVTLLEQQYQRLRTDLEQELEKSAVNLRAAESAFSIKSAAMEDTERQVNSQKGYDYLDLLNNINTLKEEISTQEAANASVERKIVETMEKTNVHKRRQSALSVEYLKLEEEIQMWGKQMDLLRRGHRTVTQNYLNMSNEKQEKETQLASLLEEIPKIDRKLKKMVTNLLLANTELKTSQQTAETLSKEVEKFVSRILKNRSEFSSKFSEISGLFHCLPAEEETESCGEKRKRGFRRSLERYLRNIDEDVDLEMYKSNSVETAISEIEEFKQKLDENPFPSLLPMIDFAAVSSLSAKKNSALTDTFSKLYSHRSHFSELKQERLWKFLEGFNFICNSFKRIYSYLTEFGDVEVEFVDAADPFSEGLSVSVRSTGKAWKQMSVLSGGEKTLVSLALIFALHEYKPNRIYLMDEIDAALDFLNVQKVAELVRWKAYEAQFIIVSLRNQMFERADQLIGVYKPQATSYVISINPSKAGNSQEEIDIDAQDVS